MTYFPGFTSHQPPNANFKGIHRDSQETKPCRVENDTQTVSRGFLSPVSKGLILVFTRLFYSKLLARSLKLGYSTLLSITMTAALRDRYKVFRLSKNNFLDNFSIIAN